MKKLFILLLVGSMIPLVCQAETKETRSAQKHELRIGYGDPMFETMRWRDEPNKLVVPMNVRQNYRYTGHMITTRTNWTTKVISTLPRAIRAISTMYVSCPHSVSRIFTTNG